MAIRLLAPSLFDPYTVAALIRSFGPLAPVALVLVQAAQVIVAPVPGQVLGFVSGYLFGGSLGTVYSMVGVTIGSYVAFRLSRAYGRPYVERSIDDDVLARFDAAVERRGVPGLFVMYLLPGLPDDVICLLAGLTDIPIRTLVVLVIVGRTPAFLLVAVAGGRLAHADLAVAGLLLAVFLVVSAVGYRYQDRLAGLIGGTTRTRSIPSGESAEEP